MSSHFDFELPFEEAGFRVLRLLGAGAMGAVYEAIELSGGRHVALKLLPPGQLRSTEALERFRREARLAASISHANCVFVYGVHEVRGLPAISMELLPGTTLSNVLLKDSLPAIHEAVNWIVQIIDGLEAAQQKGVLHRDVKPGNCFFVDDSRVKVGDFGLARSTGPDQNITQEGAFIGTPLYASPEAVKGRGVEMKSDMYSVGATLYALITGVPPFHGSDQVATMMRILTEEPQNPRAIRGEIPPELATVVLRCLSKDPSGRYASYAALRQALAPFADPSFAAKALRRTQSILPSDRNWTANGLIGDYKVVSVVARTSCGKLLRARDPSLDRDIWIHVYSPVLPARKFPDVRAGDARSMIYRQRLIKSSRDLGSPYDVYESLDGAALSTALQSGTFDVWPNAHALLVEMCDFLLADGRPRHAEQLWIDASGKLRVLDFAVGDCPSPKLDPRGLLARVALAMSSGQGLRAASDRARKLVRDIADANSNLSSLGDIAKELEKPSIRPRRVSFGQRVSQGALGVAPPTTLLVLHHFELLRVSSNVLAIVIGGLAVLSALAAVSLHGSATLRAFGLVLETRDGRTPGSARLALRALGAWIPLFVVALAGDWTAADSSRRAVAAGCLVAFVVAHAVALLADPSRGLFERATDTRVAPR